MDDLRQDLQALGLPGAVVELLIANVVVGNYDRHRAYEVGRFLLNGR